MVEAMSPILATVVLLGLLVGAAREAAPAKPEAHYAKSLETIEITADEAPVTIGETVLATVKKGRWFGLTARVGDQFRIQFWGGRNLRFGWVRASDARLLTDKDVDLATEALKLAKEFNPKLDAAKCRAQVEELATRVAAAASKATTPSDRALQISVQLFRHEGFGYDFTPRTLDKVMEERCGNCLGLSLLYLCAAEKLNMPFRMLAVPHHALIRYDDGKEQFNVEPSWGGWVFVDDAYMRRRYGPPEGINWSMLNKPQTMTMLYSDVGAVLGIQKRHDEAVSAFVRAIEINPNYGGAYLNWGNSLLALKQFGQACDKFARATQIHPTFAEAYNNWGSALNSMGETQWACEKFATAIKCNPSLANSYYNLGMGQLRLGKREEAVKNLEKAAQLVPRLRPLVDEALGHRPTKEETQ
jgi:tetratricopeptide (TPR) repeat protein